MDSLVTWVITGIYLAYVMVQRGTEANINITSFGLAPTNTLNY